MSARHNTYALLLFSLWCLHLVTQVFCDFCSLQPIWLILKLRKFNVLVIDVYRLSEDRTTNQLALDPSSCITLARNLPRNSNMRTFPRPCVSSVREALTSVLQTPYSPTPDHWYVDKWSVSMPQARSTCQFLLSHTINPNLWMPAPDHWKTLK